VSIVSAGRSWFRERPKASHPFEAGVRTWTHPGLPRWLWSGGELTYDLVDSPGEVADRIRSRVRPQRALTTFLGIDSLVGPGTLRGRVDGSRLKLTATLPFFHNAFDCLFDAEITAVPGGSRVRGSLRVRPFAVAFWVFWMTGALLFVGVLAAKTVSDPRRLGPLPLLASLGFLMLGVVFLSVARLVARPQERMIVRGLDSLLGVWTVR
jgi:hypothetical protein